MPTYEAEQARKASSRQKVLTFLAYLGIGPSYTGLAVRAEMAEKELNNVEEPPPMALAKLLEQLLGAPTKEDKYKLLVQPIPYPDPKSGLDRPELWFDYVDGLTSKDIAEGIGKTALELLPQGKSTWEKVADLGAGTGYLGAALIGKDKLPRIADSVTLVDLSPTLLKVATDRYGSDMDQTLADVTELPFADQSFDLITSGGLIYSLGTIRQEPYFEEVSRVLRAGGIYLDGDYLPGSPRHIKAGSVERFQLEWLIKSHAFLEPPFDPLEDVEDKAAYFEKFGLKLSYKEYLDETFQNRIQIRILEKAA